MCLTWIGLSIFLICRSNLIAEAVYRMVDFPLESSIENIDRYLEADELSKRIEIIWSHEADGWRYWAPSDRKDIHQLLHNFPKLTTLQMGAGYLVKYKSSSVELKFEGKTIFSNAVRLADTKHALISFNLKKPTSIVEILSPRNISTGKPSDIEEVWFFDHVRKQWALYTPDMKHKRINKHSRIGMIQPGDALWMKSKVSGLEIRINSSNPIFTITGTSQLTPPVPASRTSNSQGKVSPSLQAISDLSTTNENSSCIYGGGEEIGNAYLFSLNGDLLSSSRVTCPETIGAQLQFQLNLAEDFLNRVKQEPALAKNLVVKIELDDGREEKGVIYQDITSAMEGTDPSLIYNTSSESTFVAMVAEMTLAQEAGLPADSIKLGETGNSSNNKVINLTQFFQGSDEPIDLNRFQDLVSQMTGSTQESYVASMVKIVEELNNNPNIETSFQESVNKLYVTTPQDGSRVQKLISATMKVIGTNIEAQSARILEDTDSNPLEICQDQLLQIDPLTLQENGTIHLADACKMVENHARLAISLAGDPSTKAAAVQKFTALASELRAEELSAILTSTDEFPLLQLTASLISFPGKFAELMQANASASAALAAILGQSAKTLAKAKSLDSQITMVNNSRQRDILKAIATLEAENQKLQPVLTIAKDPEAIVRNIADFIANGGDPGTINEISELIGDKFPDGSFLDYGELITRVRKTVFDPTEIINKMITDSSDPLLGLKIFAEATHLLTREQLEQILNTKKIKDQFALHRNILAIAGRDEAIVTGHSAYTLKLDGSRSFDPSGDANLRFSWDRIDRIRGQVIENITNGSTSAKASYLVTDIPGFQTFRLTIQNLSGSRVAQDEVRYEFIPDPLPVVLIETEVQTYAKGQQATIVATASFYPGGGEITSFSWEQVAGSPVTLVENGGKFSFTPQEVGHYHFKIHATKVMSHATVNGTGDAFVEVYETFNPVVDAGLDSIIQVGEAYTLANATYHPNGLNLKYTWTPNLYLSSSSTKEPIFTPTETGTYTFTLNAEEAEVGGSSGNGTDTVTIEVVESFAPTAVTSESQLVDFREIAENSISLVLDGCSSYSVENNPPILSYSWTSTTFTSPIANANSCSASIVLTKNQYQHKKTHHFKLTVREGSLSGEATHSIRIIPAYPEPPEILVDYFPDRDNYYAGSEIDIESWRSFSYQNKNLHFAWIPMDPDSKAVSNPFRSRFQNLERDSLEISVPSNLFESTATASQTYKYRLIVTEKNEDNSLGLSSSKDIAINVYQVCPDPPFLADLVPSHTWFRKGASNTLLSIDADYRPLCLKQDGTPHDIQVTWNFDETIFTETLASTDQSLVVSMDLRDDTLTPGGKTFQVTVKDLVNLEQVSKSIQVEIFDEIECELSFEFPGQTTENGFIKLLPDLNHTLVGDMDCRDSEGVTSYESKPSQVRVFRQAIDSAKSALSEETLIHSYDSGSTAPLIDFEIETNFSGIGMWKLRIEKEHLDQFEEGKLVQKLKEIYVNADYLPLEPEVSILSLTDSNGVGEDIQSLEYEGSTTALSIDFILSASGTTNPNQNPQPISYLWNLSNAFDTDDITIINPTNAVATARITGMDPFETNQYQIELIASSSQTPNTILTLAITLNQDNVQAFITNVDIAGGNIYNNVSITFDLIDFEGENSTIKMEYSTGESDWQTSAYVFSKGQALDGLNVSPGIFHGLIWEAHKDLAPGVYESMEIRLTPTDIYGRTGGEGISQTVELNIPQIPVVKALIEDRNCRDQGNNLILVNDSSYAGGCVTDVIEFHLQGAAEKHPYEDSFRFQWSSDLSIPGLNIPGLNESYAFNEEEVDQSIQWSLGEEASAARMHLNAVQFNEKVYHWGGGMDGAREVFNSMQIYDITEDSWSIGASGGTSRRQHSAVLFQDRIFYYGGRHKAFQGTMDPPLELSRAFDIYDIAQDSWERMEVTEALDVTFLQPLGVLHKEKIYHFSAWKPATKGSLGSAHYQNKIYIFDLQNNHWEILDSTGAPTLDQLDPQTANLYRGKIVYTGNQASGNYRRVWIYDIASNTWTRGTPSTNIPWSDSLATGKVTAFRSKIPSISHQGTPPEGSQLWRFGNPEDQPYAMAAALSPTEDSIWIAGKALSQLTTDTGKIICSFAVEDNNSGFESPAVARDGTVFATVNDQTLYAVDSHCQLRWKVGHLSEDDGTNLKDAKRPAIAHDPSGYTKAVYVPSGPYLIAFDNYGREIWRFKTGGHIRPEVTINSPFAKGKKEKSGANEESDSLGGKVYEPIIGADGTIYFTSMDRRLYAINPDGSDRWFVQLPSVVTEEPAIGPDGTIYVNGKYLSAIGPDGSFKWVYESNSGSSPFVDSSGTIYLTRKKTNQGLVALNPDGSIRWTLDSMFRDHIVAAEDGTIYVGNQDKHMYAINQDGQVLWAYEVEHRVAASPKLSNHGVLYFRSGNHEFHALQVKSMGLADSPFPTFQGDNQNSGNYYVRSRDFNYRPPSAPPGPVLTPAFQAQWDYQGCQDRHFEANFSIGSNGDLYVNCGYPTNEFLALRADGNRHWAHSYNEFEFPILTEAAVQNNGDIVYVVAGLCEDANYACTSGKLVSSDSSGAIQWEQRIDVEFPSSPSIGQDGTIYVGTLVKNTSPEQSRGRLYAFNADGRLKWNVKTQGSLLAPAIAEDGTIFLAGQYLAEDSDMETELRLTNAKDATGLLYAFHPEGELRWSRKTDYALIAVPAIGPNGAVHVMTRKRLLVLNPGEIGRAHV